MTTRKQSGRNARTSSGRTATLERRKRGSPPAPKKKSPRYTARTADRYELYQLAVQSPENDVAFLRRLFRRIVGRQALHFREDFCGTALLCATWVKQGAAFTAEGVDLDPEPLAWGREHNLAPLGDDARRIELHQADVRAPSARKADLRVAQNFSFCIFKQRAELLEYFRIVREGLADDGVFALDLYGGTESTMAMEEPRKVEGGFTYVWDQARYLPGSGDYTCHIHFRFRDGTEMRKAFSYEWRYWGLPELKDLLREAGFSRVSSYFEQTDDEDGSGNGVFVRDETGASCEDCAGWIAYVIAQK